MEWFFVLGGIGLFLLSALAYTRLPPEQQTIAAPPMGLFFAAACFALANSYGRDRDKASKQGA